MVFASPQFEIQQLRAELATALESLQQKDAELAQSEESRRRLELIIDALRREKFGRKSEKLTPEQRNLPLEGEGLARHRFEGRPERVCAGGARRRAGAGGRAQRSGAEDRAEAQSRRAARPSAAG